MNADALLLYSYLMRQDIPFTRFCHPAYRDRTQWIQSLKNLSWSRFFRCAEFSSAPQAASC